VGERGQALIEAVVATAIVAVVLGAALSAAVAANAHLGRDPAAQALDAALAREMTIARDLVKYQGTALSPASIQTSVPLPDASALPVTLQLDVATPQPGGVVVTVVAQAQWRGALQRRSLTSALLVPAPLPGTSVALPGLAPAPTGAP
jgi:hypothetical protein